MLVGCCTPGTPQHQTLTDFSCVLWGLQLPLYPATTVYLQLMSESRSRINACDKASDSRITGVPSVCDC
jgi:hypothetical protein